MSDETPALLTIDRGNSTFDWLFHGDGSRATFDALVDERARMHAFLASHRVRECVASTVVPGGLHVVRDVLSALGVPLRVAGVDLPCPLPLAYDTPHTLGTDRWLSALAAHRRHGRAVVVDCGSATTVNLVEADGTFQGGAIAPGLRAFVAGLAAVTPGLPTPDLDATTSVPSRSSQAAVDTGVLLGYCGLVERLVAETLRAAAGPARVLVTGGNGKRLLRLSRLRADLEPDLVHHGLRLLAEGTA